MLRRWTARAGFTLVELMVAVSLLGIVAAAVYGTISRSAASRDHALGRLQRVGQLRSALDWMARDLEDNYATGLQATEITVLSSSGSAGLRSAYSGLALLELTVLSARGVTVVDEQAWGGLQQRDRGDQARVVYMLEHSEPATETEATMELARYEFRPPVVAPLEEADRRVVATGLQAVDLRFFDGADWLASWQERPGSSPKQKTPELVELSVTAAAGKDGPALELTMAVLPGSGR